MINKKPYLSIIITCYNEASKINADIDAVESFSSTLKKPIELIIVDDRSQDNTVNIVKRRINKIPWIHLLFVQGSQHGKGIGLKTGIMVAKGKYIMFTDAGLCVPIDNVLKGITKLESGSDLSIGSRALKNSILSIKQSWYRQLGSRIFWLLLKLFMGIPRGIRDTQCGFKVYKHDIAKKLYGDSFTPGFMIDIETILRAKKLNYKISQFSVNWTNDPDSRYKIFSGSVKNFIELVRIKKLL